MNNIQITFNGIQEDSSLQPAFYTFTDNVSGGTFLIKISEKHLFSSIEKRTLEIRKQFEETKL